MIRPGPPPPSPSRPLRSWLEEAIPLPTSRSAMVGADLATRLARRIALPAPACDDLGRDCGPLQPTKLSAAEGSQRLGRQLRAFVATVVRARTMPELREECRLCSLSANGQKEELVERITGAIGGFSSGRLVETQGSTPPRRRLSIKSSEETPPPPPAKRRRLSVKSPEVPPPEVKAEQRLLSVRRLSGPRR
uniref:SAP domain-containing protein n=1 Tax=Alexandrium catenella TaxID=2925 RepID=A0A7S1RRZ9_ALECA